MAEVRGLRSRNHFDSNCNTDRDEGKSRRGVPPAVAGAGWTRLLVRFSLNSGVFVWTQVCLSVSRIHLFSAADPRGPARQLPRCWSLFAAQKRLQRGLWSESNPVES